MNETAMLSITNVRGNLLPMNRWASSGKQPLSVFIDENGRTVVNSTGNGSAYLIADGTGKDFKRLSSNAGTETQGHRAIKLTSFASFSGKARATVLVLEYDGNRNRIGELSVKVPSSALLTLRPETKFVLVAMRVVGTGSTVLEWLSVDLLPDEAHSKQPGIDYMKHQNLLDQGRGQGDANKRLALARTLLESIDPASLTSPQKDSSSQDQVNRSQNPGVSATANAVGLAEDLLVELAKTLPASNGSRHFRPLPVTAGIIADEGMYDYYKSAIEEVIYLSPANYEDVFRKRQLDVIIFASGWHGLERDDWSGVLQHEEPNRALSNVLDLARAYSVKSIFHSTEDPQHFELFLPLAKKFDYVFTSSSASIEHYRSVLENEQVYESELGVDPLTFNPIGSRRVNLSKGLFSSTGAEQPSVWKSDVEPIIQAFPNPADQFVVLDCSRNEKISLDYGELSPTVLPLTNMTLLPQLHKLFEYNVLWSPIERDTAISGLRTREMLALGKPVLSNYSYSIFNEIPEIRVIAHEGEKVYPASHEAIFQEQITSLLLAIRALRENSVFEAVARMMETIGLPAEVSRKNTILVVAFGDEEQVRNSVSKQLWVNATVCTAEELRLGVVRQEDFGYIAGMSGELTYEATYLASRFTAFKYTDSDFVTQESPFTDNISGIPKMHEFTTSTSARELTMVSTDVRGATAFVLGDSPQIAGKGYIVEPFHVGFREYLRSANQAANCVDPRVSVIVPVYNNGKFLRAKCIPSLLRNKCWKQMEVILVDDGSTDSTTLEICADLCEMYPNIRFYSFSDGGSGSASRPRNKGIELATTELVTFLDPDNEISPGGYDSLLEHFDRLHQRGANSDFVSGFQVKIGAKKTITGRHTRENIRTVGDAREAFFAKGKFPVISTQAAVMKKALLIDNGIFFIEGAAGQDTLFGWEVLMAAENPSFTSDCHLIYYAERAGSVTNVVDLAYFEKCLVKERAQVEILQRLELFDFFKKHHFTPFMNNWYLVKLESVAPHSKLQARMILGEIAALYGEEMPIA